MPAALVQYERKAHVAILTLNRSERLNALNHDLLGDLSEVANQAVADPEVRVIVITGSGRAFCAGGDLSEINQIANSVAMYRWLRKVQQVFLHIEALPKPTICAINGLALGGGCELALACDIRLIESNAAMGTPEINVGLLPAGGGMSRLVALVGLGRAKEMAMFGRRVTADQAVAMGLVNALVPPGELMATALKWAEELAAKSPVAIQLAKSTIHDALHLDAHSAADLEAKTQATLFGSEDCAEGIRAFIEKRTPIFTGQ